MVARPGWSSRRAPAVTWIFVTATRPVESRASAIRKARRFNRLTIGWNVAEAVVALAAGIAAGSVSLVGFGLDSCIEVSESVILAWRLHQENRGGCMAENDK